MLFEPDTAFLRYVRAGDEEIVRGMYVAVRDHNWGTVEPLLSDLDIYVREDAFDIHFVADCRQGDIHFVWRGAITGSSHAVVQFSMDGEAHSRFQRSRIGFCVLHPMSVAGRACSVEHVDGSLTHGEFPSRVSPHQPFMDIRAISYELPDGGSVDVRMDGDTFEMEDQRNWTDASYKTYCTPLALPFPVTLDAGDHVRQSVTTTAMRGASGSSRPIRRSVDAVPVVRVSEEVLGRTPAIGLGSPSHEAVPTEAEVAHLRDLRPGHLRVDIRTADSAWQGAATRAARLAANIDAPLEVAVLLPPASAEEAVQGILDWAQAERPRVARWIVLHDDMSTTSAATLAVARQVLSACGDAPFGMGTDCYFTELNRERPATTDADFVSYSMNPQVHAFDDASLMETLEAQAVTVDSARAFANGMPITVSPVTLRPRFNPNATGDPAEAASDELPFEVDPRQMSLFTAAWTLGSVASLASAGAEGATYYEPTGLRGVMDASALENVPRDFARVEGGVYPAYHVLRDVCAFAGGHTRRSEVSDTLAISALALQSESQHAVWVANLTLKERTVRIEGLAPGRHAVRTLDVTNATRAMLDPEAYRDDIAYMDIKQGATVLALGAYGVARIGSCATEPSHLA
jgi:D-apionolactonase